MKILHVITRMVVGGAQENTLLTVVGQRAAGYDSVLATGPSEGEEGEMESRARTLRVPILFVPDLVRDPNPMRDLRATAALYGMIRRGGYTLVHTHTSKAGVLGRVAARLARVPAVIHTPHGHIFHSYYSPMKTRMFWLMEWACSRFCDRIIALTENEKREHVELRIASERRFATIHSGVDFSHFLAPPAPNASRRGDFGIPDGALVIGCVARLVPIKGHRYLLDAMLAVLNKVPEARLLLVGDGPYTDDLKAQAREAGISDRVIFTGLRRDIPDLLRLMDIFALASLNEGMGRVLVEAMACRLPVVATRVSGIPGVVDHGKTGLLVEPRSPRQMAEALVALARDRGLARRLGEAGFHKVVPEFSVEVMVDDINTLYREVLAEKGLLAQAMTG